MKTLYKSIIVITLASVLLTGCTNKLNYKSEFKKNTSLNNEYKINGEICKNRSKPDTNVGVRPDAKTEFNRTVKRS